MSTTPLVSRLTDNKLNDVKRSKYTLEDFLTDESFLSFVLDDSDSSAEYWNRFLNGKHPELREIAQQAKDILLFNNENKSILSAEEVDNLKKNILNDISIKEK